jgi:hypothetical protein
MVRYNLKLKNGDVINTITANSYEEAIEIFCFTKKFERDTLLKLYDVEKEN